MKVISASLLWIFLASVATDSQAASPQTRCDRTCLGSVLESFFASVQARDPTLLRTTPDIRYTLDGTPTKFGSGLWQDLGNSSYRLIAIDPDSQQVAANAVVATNGKKAILFVRLRVKGSKVSELEATLVRPGEGQRSDPDRLNSAPPTLYQQSIPLAKRAPRQELIAAADAYFEGIANAGTPQYKSPPLAPNAVRVEDGVQTAGPPTNGAAHASSIDDQFRHGFGHDKLHVSERRYPVVDREHGIVVAIGLMHIDRGSYALPPAAVGLHAVDSPHLREILVEFFKIQDGQIREIQANLYDLNDPKIDTGWEATKSRAVSAAQ